MLNGIARYQKFVTMVQQILQHKTTMRNTKNEHTSAMKTLR